MIYFDHNATTPLCEAARDAWLQSQETAWANPSAAYTAAVKAKAELRLARDQLARLLGVAADELVFTSGATEACNLWLESFFRNRHSEEKLLVSELDHSCVVETCKRLDEDAVCWFCPSSSVSIREMLDRESSKVERVGAVVMMAANNVTGEIFDWKGAAEWCRQRGIPFFCDTTQWLGKYGPEGLDKLDFFCGSAHKFGGPKGVGFLKLSRRHRSLCGQTGGGQEGGLRAGTEDLAGIRAMVAALNHYHQHCYEAGAIQARIEWKEAFKSNLRERISGVVDHERSPSVLWNTVSVSLPDKASDWWIQQLDRRGFSIAAGSACSTGDETVSRVISAMGMDPETAKRTIRLSAGWNTAKLDWQQLLDAIVGIYNGLIGQKQDASAEQSQVEVISLDDL